MPLEVSPQRTSRFGSPLVLSRVHWVRPELVTEVEFFTWTDDNLLRQVVPRGLREDKPAAAGRRPTRNSPRRRVPPFAQGGRAAEVPDRPAERGRRFRCGVCLVNLTKWLALTGNERNS